MQKNDRIKSIILYVCLLMIQCISLCAVLVIVLKYEDQGEKAVIFVILAVMMLVLLGILFAVCAVKNIRMWRMYDFYADEKEMMDEHYAEMRKQYNALRKLRHDFHSHVETMDLLRKREQDKEADEYLKAFRSEFEKIEAVSFCSIPALDALLYSKAEEAHRKGIRTEIKIGEIERNVMTDYDLCSVVSNMLRNAVEGAKNFTGRKYIAVECFEKSGFLVISVKNSAEPPQEDLQTTKSDPGRHGIGTGIIRSLVKKYNGNVVFRYEKKYHVFVCIINIPIKSEK